MEVFDYLDGAHNRCGVYTLEMFVDEHLAYKHVMDEFSFSETRYINAHIDYERRIQSGTKAHRLHRLPNDRLRIYSKSTENRVLKVEETREYQIRIVATDVAGNRSTLEFSLMGEQGKLGERFSTDSTIHISHEKAFKLKEGPVQVDLPAGALYEDLDFTFGSTPIADGSLTPFYNIASSTVPVHLSYTLSILSPEVDPSLRRKLLLVSYDDKELVSVGGEYQDGAVSAKLRNFGDFAVALDTIAPEILPYGNRGNDYSGKKSMRFIIRDELSGIAKYEGYIDNHWALFEYDPKNDLLEYSFDNQHITPETEHELELYVTDEKGNTSLYQNTFIW